MSVFLTGETEKSNLLTKMNIAIRTAACNSVEWSLKISPMEMCINEKSFKQPPEGSLKMDSR